MIKQVLLVDVLQSLANDHLRRARIFGYRVDVLDLDEGLHLFLKHFLEEVLQLVAPKKLENFLPVRRCRELTEVRLHVAGKNAECGGLASAVRADQTQDFARARRRQSMQLEAVCAVTVCHLVFEALRQIDDRNRLKRAPLNAHTAPDAECFGDVAYFGRFCHLDTHFARFIDWAGLLTFLSTLFGLAFVSIDDGDSQFICVHFSSN